MRHIILTAPFDASTWESCRPFVERALAQVKDFHAEIDIGLWVFRTQECYSVVHELEHFFANRGIRFLSVPHDGPLPCGVSPAAGEALRALGVEVCNVTTTRFQPVNFSSKKHDLGFSLMNQLSVAEKRFPKCAHDIAADYFALRKVFTGNRWIFTEGRNAHNPASHCDIAWAGALATHAHTTKKSEAWALAG